MVGGGHAKFAAPARSDTNKYQMMMTPAPNIKQIRAEPKTTVAPPKMQMNELYSPPVAQAVPPGVEPRPRSP